MITSKNTKGVTNVRNPNHQVSANSSASSCNCLDDRSLREVSPESSEEDTTTLSRPKISRRTIRSSVAACTTIRRGLSELLTSTVTGGGLGVKVGKELRRFMLVFRSSVVGEEGRIRRDAFRASDFSRVGPSTFALGGREGARDGGRDDAREGALDVWGSGVACTTTNNSSSICKTVPVRSIAPAGLGDVVFGRRLRAPEGSRKKSTSTRLGGPTVVSVRLGTIDLRSTRVMVDEISGKRRGTNGCGKRSSIVCVQKRGSTSPRRRGSKPFDMDMAWLMLNSYDQYGQYESI
jgi:hypothetical protein